MTRDAETRASPELALDVYGRTRLARYTGPIGTPTRTMTFQWTVRRGDYDPDGLVVRGLVLNGATVLDSQARRTPPDRFPAEHFRVHRVRGGYFETQIKVTGPAREGAPFTIRATRDGDVDARGFAAVEVADSAMETVQQIAVEFYPKDSQLSDGQLSDGRNGSFTLTPPPDGEAVPDGERTMTVRLHDTASRSVWYDAAGTLEITVKVEDNALPTDVPVLAVGPADVHEPETGSVPMKFRVCLWTADELCPDAGKNEAFEAYEGVTHQVTVDYATRDGTAEARRDYLPTSGTLTFEPGETVKTVEVMVLADAVDEGVETVWLELSNPVGATLGRWRNFGQIHNDGPIPKAWIVRFGRTVGSQVVDRLTQRLEAGDESQATLGGISLFGDAEPDETALKEPTLGLPGWEEERTRLDAERTMTGEELLLGSAFHLSRGNREEGPVFTAWGSVAVGGFDATEDDLTLDGVVTTGILGVDASTDRFMAGLMLSQSEGDGSYVLGTDAERSDEGRIEASLTALYPYLEAKLTERVSAWGLVGAGSGDLTVSRDDEVLETGLSMRMGAIGVTGTGLEVGAGLRYVRGPVSIEGQVRGLVAHEAAGYQEWGASAAVRVSPESGRGLIFSIAPVWGQAGSATDRLWGARDARELEGGEFEATGRLEAELGYGVGVPGNRGVVTPYTGLSLADGAGRTLRAGTRWDVGPGAVMGLEGRREGGSEGAEGSDAIEFRLELRW